MLRKGSDFTSGILRTSILVSSICNIIILESRKCKYVSVMLFCYGEINNQTIFEINDKFQGCILNKNRDRKDDRMLIRTQLYSFDLKCTTEEGIRETFKIMKAQGYESVQISGFDYEAEKVKLYAEEFDLHVGLTHTPISKIMNETDEVIRIHKVMGADVVGIGYPSGYVEDGIVNVDRLISDLKPAVEKIKTAGLGFGYHNHAMEFLDLGGYCTMDILFEKTDWNFILDIGWCDVAGADVVEAIRKYASRLRYVHLKDFREAHESDLYQGDRIVPLYHGLVPLDEAIVALKEAGTVVVAYVEQDNASDAEDPYAEMKESIDQLKERGWV